ncbi:MAG: twitching motility protein PilT [Acidimicrobiia bacterium]|nr:twitching motility protein PilT [Acidimicrobiia bacterium]MCY4432029.1 twitching motility protein PilT [bacterium]
MILDAGALIALEGNDRHMWERFNVALQSSTPPITHGGVVAQVWRGGTGRQARLARALDLVKVIPLDEELGRRAGVLLSQSGLTDAIDAALAALANPGDQIITSDPDDLALLVEVGKLRVDIVPV